MYGISLHRDNGEAPILAALRLALLLNQADEIQMMNAYTKVSSKYNLISVGHIASAKPLAPH